MVEKILVRLPRLGLSQKVTNIRIGAVYTAVQLENGQVGLAYNFRSRDFGRMPIDGNGWDLVGNTAGRFLEFLRSDNLIQSSLGLATVNALARPEGHEILAGDVLDVVRLYQTDRVGMVGFFEPLAKVISFRVRSLQVFERDRNRFSDLLPEEKALEVLPQCDVAIITSTSILNRTVDELLKVSGHCREVILLGPSTPLLPEAFQGTAVTFLSGVEVTNPESVLRVVSEGGGMRHFKGLIRKVNISLRSGA